MRRIICRALVPGRASGGVLWSDVALSFWGGVDPATGIVIDAHHPLRGQALAGHVLVLPDVRGSCSGSGVLLELIRAGKAPAAIVLARPDTILPLGAVVAGELFDRSLPVGLAEPGPWARLAQAGEVEIEAAEGARAPLRLTARDQAMLAGEAGEAAAVAMRILCRMARLQGAAELIDVSRVHIDGCLYTGPAGLAFARLLAERGGRVRVPTSLNAVSVDLRRWTAQGVEAGFGRAASDVAAAYVAMGARATYTCAPYQLDGAPAAGEQIAWAESNAVVYANSVLGARTAKYPDFLDACVALTGRAPLAGPHLDGHRRARVVIEVDDLGPVDDVFYPLLGYHAGLLAGDRVPVLTGLPAQAGLDDLRALGAAFATTSSAPMFHAVGLTPEAPTLDAALGGSAPDESFRAGTRDLLASWTELGGAGDGPVDLVALGNPHASFDELAKLAALVRGRRRHDGVAVVVTCNRETSQRLTAEGLSAILEGFGVRFVNDTCWCMIGEPVIPPGTRAILTNSGKYAHYGPGLSGRPVRLASLAQCVEAACAGRFDRRPPPWLASGGDALPLG